MDAAREVAQLLQGELGLLARPGAPARRRRVAARGPLLGHPQVERERHEPLLRAVVKVALDAAPLGVGGGDDARARVLELRHLGGELGVGVRAEQLLGEPAVQPAEGARPGMPTSRTSAPTGRPRAPRRACPPRASRPVTVRERPVVERARTAPSPSRAPSPRPRSDRIPSGSWSSRKARSFQVAGSARRAGKRRPPAHAHGIGPVGARDLDADERPMRRRSTPRASATPTRSRSAPGCRSA